MALRDLVEQARELRVELPKAAADMDDFGASTDRIVRNAEALNDLGREALVLSREHDAIARDRIARGEETISGGTGGGGGGGRLVSLLSSALERLGFRPALLERQTEATEKLISSLETASAQTDHDVRLPDSDRPGRAGGAHARKGDDSRFYRGPEGFLGDSSPVSGFPPGTYTIPGGGVVTPNPAGGVVITWPGGFGSQGSRASSGPQDVVVTQPTPGERLIVGELRSLRTAIGNAAARAPAATTGGRTVDYRAQGVI